MGMEHWWSNTERNCPSVILSTTSRTHNNVRLSLGLPIDRRQRTAQGMASLFRTSIADDFEYDCLFE
jgi:hypothetical protein